MLLALLVLAPFGVALACDTEQQAMDSCGSYITYQTTNDGYWSCRLWEHAPGQFVVRLYRFENGQNNTWPYCADEEPECEAGGDPFTGEFDNIDAEFQACSTNGCEYEMVGGGINIGQGWHGEWEQTGQTCSGGEEPSVDAEDCRPVGGGYEVCRKNDQVCVTTARGNEYCWNPEAEQCNTSGDGREAACIGSPEAPDPPNNPDDSFDDWDPPIEIQVGTSSGPVTVEVRTRDPSNPDDDEDDEDDPDCPANDPECEDDDDELTAADSGCETETPSCSDTSAVECQILYRTHRTKCEIEHSNKLLAEFRDKQLEEVRETNAKIKAFLEHEKEWRAEQVIQASEQKAATIEVKTEVAAAKVAIVTAVEGTGGDILDELGEIKDELAKPTEAAPSLTCATAPSCGGDPIGCAQLVQSWRAGCLAGGSGDGTQPAWTQVEPGSAGEGVTAEDGERIGVTSRTLSVSDVDDSGFLGGGSCPVLPQLSIGGTTVEIDPAIWCDFLALLKVVFAIAGAWAAVQILTR